MKQEPGGGSEEIGSVAALMIAGLQGEAATGMGRPGGGRFGFGGEGRGTVMPVSAVRRKKMGSQVLAGDWRKEIKTSGEGRLRLDRGLKKKKRGASNVKKKIKTRGRACLAFGWRMIGGT